MLNISAVCPGIQEGSFRSVNWWVKALLTPISMMRYFCILVTKGMTLVRNDGELLIDRQFVVGHMLYRICLWEGQKSVTGVLSVNYFLQNG